MKRLRIEQRKLERNMVRVKLQEKNQVMDPSETKNKRCSKRTEDNTQEDQTKMKR